jgi:hypothetical protein
MRPATARDQQHERSAIFRRAIPAAVTPTACPAAFGQFQIGSPAGEATPNLRPAPLGDRGAVQCRPKLSKALVDTGRNVRDLPAPLFGVARRPPAGPAALPRVARPVSDDNADHLAERNLVRRARQTFEQGRSEKFSRNVLRCGDVGDMHRLIVAARRQHQECLGRVFGLLRKHVVWLPVSPKPGHKCSLPPPITILDEGVADASPIGLATADARLVFGSPRGMRRVGFAVMLRHRGATTEHIGSRSAVR